jgi:hypothetical protein
MPVDRLKHAAQSTSALRGEACVSNRRAIPQKLRKSYERRDPVGAAFIHGNDGRKRLPRLRSVDQEKSDRCRAVSDPQT